MKVKTKILIFILILLIILLILNTIFFNKENFIKKEFSKPQTIEPKILESGFYYPIELEELQYNFFDVVERAEIKGYAIRNLIKSQGCKNPLPEGGCKGGDFIPPEYDYINVNFNLSDEKRGYSTIDGAWENSPNKIGVENDNIHLLEFVKKGHTIRVIGYPFFISSEDINTTDAKGLIIEEFENLGIVLKGNIVFGEGYKNEMVLENEELDPYSCNVDSDCVVKDVHNCCGYYPRCVNKGYEPDIDAVRKMCEEQNISSICGWSGITHCECMNNTCVSMQDDMVV